MKSGADLRSAALSYRLRSQCGWYRGNVLWMESRPGMQLLCSGAFFLYKNLRNRKMYFQSTPLGRRNKYDGICRSVKAKETLGIAQILEGSYEGKKIRMNGAVHNVRDMGEVAL